MTQTPGRLAGRLAVLPVWARAILAFGAGAVGALAQEPYGITPLVLASMVAGFALLPMVTTWQSAVRIGWFFGTGYFALCLTWIVEPFQIDAAQHGWMAPFALVLLSAGLALFWGAAFGLAKRLGPSRWWLAATWPLAEIGRAYVFTGFPWAMPPQALVNVVAGQGLAWVGPHGMMLALCLIAALLSRPIVMRFGVALQSTLALISLAVLLVAPVAPQAAMTEHTIRIVQPNAPQHEKWDPQMIPVFVDRQVGFTAQPGDVDLILWPETALPYLVEHAQVVFDRIAEASSGKPVALGIQRRSEQGYFNSMVVLDEAGQVTQTYDKHHLVPFGEYMPFPSLFSKINVGGLADRVDGAFISGPGPQLLDMGLLGRALPLICYEAVFAHDVGGAAVRPDFLMQLTNDAWFGAFAGPQQHLAQARMRAIEQGLPLVRSANTGISAMIDPNGRITDQIPLDQAGFVDAALPRPLAPTLYSRTGDLPIIGFLVLATLLMAIKKRTVRTPFQD
ncbi:MAG: apolipoprotein N-acyltransferase [Pseudomonadota bacterium]